jgi:hypothetical protein
MKTQMIKGFAMLTLILTMAVATAVVSNAQSSVRVKANVPFEFIVGDQTLPAGSYSVSPAVNSGDALKIQNNNEAITTLRLTTPMRRMNDEEGKLVFHRYGEIYFLREVWKEGEQAGRQFRESKHERALKRELAALAQYDYEVVEIALQ